MTQDNLTAKQNDYAVFLPAISGFYATFIGKQRDPVNGPYVDPARMPAGIKDMEMMNWLNSSKGMFPYKWSLYSGGHANLDLNKQDWSEDMARNRDPNTFVLGDSGGFQIGKLVWEADWKDPLCPRAAKKRQQVLNWMDTYMDYGMCLDIPVWIERMPDCAEKSGISSAHEALVATKIKVDALTIKELAANRLFIINRLLGNKAQYNNNSRKHHANNCLRYGRNRNLKYKSLR